MRKNEKTTTIKETKKKTCSSDTERAASALLAFNFIAFVCRRMYVCMYTNELQYVYVRIAQTKKAIRREDISKTMCISNKYNNHWQFIKHTRTRTRTHTYIRTYSRESEKVKKWRNIFQNQNNNQFAREKKFNNNMVLCMVSYCVWY